MSPAIIANDLVGRIVSAEYIHPQKGVAIEVGVVAEVVDASAITVWFVRANETRTIVLDQVLSIGERIRAAYRIPISDYIGELTRAVKQQRVSDSMQDKEG